MLKLIEKDLQIDTLKKLYRDPKDMGLAWTKAHFPFDEKQWREWFTEGAEKAPYSLYLELDGIPIGHSAVLNYKTGAKISYLCFLIIDNEYRGQGFGKELVRLTCDFIRERLGDREAYLMVDHKNKTALECYLSCGFSYVDGDNPRRYKKKL